MLSQDPSGGTTVAKGKNVALSICSPPPPTVPDVVGMTQQNAVAVLANADLTATTTTTADCKRTDFGNVVNQDPTGGGLASPNASVSIIVCNNNAEP